MTRTKTASATIVDSPKADMSSPSRSGVKPKCWTAYNESVEITATPRETKRLSPQLASEALKSSPLRLPTSLR
eukprot:CAMPEP_0178771180 /NCGR_PEP_ID=MMETSP0744-20121128/21798_1 /TAXON_ID=913974 /ORGANISM="Nitzschia punctata, Strain CCMP561" /LENGTH=72 /DNA_ID=CAMNT_0020427627 /DNA_START=344 /DNA_END=562 /DNA_ORIENTATION=+